MTVKAHNVTLTLECDTTLFWEEDGPKAEIEAFQWLQETYLQSLVPKCFDAIRIKAIKDENGKDMDF